MGDVRYRDAWRRRGQEGLSDETAVLFATDRADTFRVIYRRPNGTERKSITLHGTPHSAWEQADRQLRGEGFELARPAQHVKAEHHRVMREGKR